MTQEKKVEDGMKSIRNLQDMADRFERDPVFRSLVSLIENGGDYPFQKRRFNLSYARLLLWAGELQFLSIDKSKGVRLGESPHFHDGAIKCVSLLAGGAHGMIAVSMWQGSHALGAERAADGYRIPRPAVNAMENWRPNCPGIREIFSYGIRRES